MSTMPAARPVDARFSSGPCAKRPGWSPKILENAALGRSHRAKAGKAKLKLAIDLTREILRIPQDYRIGITPACGLAGATPQWARTAIGLARRAADAFAEDPDAI